MADIANVEDAFVQIIAQTLLPPNTVYTPYSTVTSTLSGSPQFRAYRGWPMDTQLRNDLKAGIANISIFSAEGLARNTTRFLRAMTTQIASQASATLTATMTTTAGSSVVTFAGTATPSEVIGIGSVTSGYSYRVQAQDTPSTIASAFAANMPNASSSGPVLTINTPNEVSVAFAGDFTMLTEVHRQVQTVRVSVWTPTTELRDQICALLDPAIQFYDRFTFPDGSISGPICSAGTHVDDMVGIDFMWRRDLLYDVEYATMYQQIVSPMTLNDIAPIKQFI